MTRADLIERMARALCRLRIEINLRMDREPRDGEFLQRAEDAGWSNHVSEAEAALTAIEAAGLAVVPVEPDDEFWSKVRFHEGEHSRSGETYPVQRNLHRAMVEAGRVR